MMVQKFCVGCLASCIVISAAGDIVAHVDFALSSVPVHLQKAIKHDTLECRQALKRGQVKQYLRAAATLSAPLQVAIVWKLFGGHQPSVELTDAEQEDMGEILLAHHSQSLQHQAPRDVSPSIGWMSVIAGTLSCLTVIVFALALAHCFMKRRLVLQKLRCKQRTVEVTIPRRRRLGRGRTLACNYQERCHLDSSRTNNSICNRMLPAPGSIGDHQKRHLVSSLSTSSSTSDLVLPEPGRNVTDTSVCNSDNQSDEVKSEQLRMAALARHIKILGIDKRPVVPVGLSNTAVGVVKDRCETINTSLERQQSVEVPEFTTQFLNEESMSDKIQDLSKQFGGERLERRNQRRKTAPAGTITRHDIDQIIQTSSRDELPQFGGCQQIECSDRTLPNFGGTSQTIKSSDSKEQLESISRFMAG